MNLRDTKPVEAYLPLLMTKRQVAYLLSTSLWGVEELARQGHLTPLTNGTRTTRYSADDVRAFIARKWKEKLPD